MVRCPMMAGHRERLLGAAYGKYAHGRCYLCANVSVLMRTGCAQKVQALLLMRTRPGVLKPTLREAVKSVATYAHGGRSGPGVNSRTTDEIISANMRSLTCGNVIFSRECLCRA